MIKLYSKNSDNNWAIYLDSYGLLTKYVNAM